MLIHILFNFRQMLMKSLLDDTLIGKIILLRFSMVF